MISKKEIQNETDSLVSIKIMVETYQEIAAVRMERTRDAILNSRLFFEEMNQIFKEIKTSYHEKVKALMRKNKIKDPKKLTFIKRNGKTLFLFISANTGLYGNIVHETFDLFLSAVKSQAGDAAIIGRLGLKLYEATGNNKKAVYFDFPDSSLDNPQLRKIASFLLSYEEVIAFYEKFQNIVIQKPAVSGISGNALDDKKTSENIIKYFFEPSLENILVFFESEIFAFILEQTIKESQLAKFAARVISLDAATENIEKTLSGTILEGRKLAHRTQNKKQMETLSGIPYLWNK